MIVGGMVGKYFWKDRIVRVGYMTGSPDTSLDIIRIRNFSPDLEVEIYINY